VGEEVFHALSQQDGVGREPSGERDDGGRRREEIDNGHNQK